MLPLICCKVCRHMTPVKHCLFFYGEDTILIINTLNSHRWNSLGTFILDNLSAYLIEWRFL